MCKVNGDAGELGAPPFDLAGVDSDADLEADLAGGVADGRREADGAGRSVERSQDPVTGYVCGDVGDWLCLNSIAR